VDQERREPRLRCDHRRHGCESIEADVERGQAGQHRQRAEGGVGETDVLNRERREIAEAGQRRQRRQAVGHDGHVARDERQ
jgi:hypothetical protein